jgi:anti-anti-sigma factor
MQATRNLNATISAEERGDGTADLVVSFSGELDLSTAPFARSVVDCVFGDPPRRLVLDLENLRFMSSPGLDVVAYCATLARRHGCTVEHRGASGTVALLLALLETSPLVDA